MTGNALLDFFVGVILLVAVVAVFFLTVEKIVKDPLLIKIGKVVIGALALVILIIAAWGALFGGSRGGAVVSGAGLIYFAVGFLIVIAVVFVIDRVIAYFGFMVAELQYLLGLVALIAVLLLAGDALFGGGRVMGSIGGHLSAPGPIIKER